MKVFIRSGGMEPWGKIIFVSGIDAPAYFNKKGVIVPDYYKDWVSYKENDRLFSCVPAQINSPACKTGRPAFRRPCAPRDTVSKKPHITTAVGCGYKKRYQTPVG